MKRNDVENAVQLGRALDRLCPGDRIPAADVAELVRIERALHRAAERDCNGGYERGDDGGWTRIARNYRGDVVSRVPCPDPYARLLERAASILASTDAHLCAYHQTDPRGCALYVYRSDDPKAERIEQTYPAIGVAVCI